MKAAGMLALLAISLTGCAPARRAHANVPGCNAPVAVPAGCYTQVFPDHLEVRCPGKTWKYRCTPEGDK